MDSETKGCFAMAGCAGLIVVAALLLFIPLRGCTMINTVASNAAKAVEEQLDARTLIKRYEWFKDASAQLDKKLVDLKVYEKRFQLLKDEYAGKPRSDWAREDREQFNLWSSEVAGIESSYNTLAAEYNAAMAKINYRWTNYGDMPAGASQPLPKEVKPYSLGVRP